jgi:peptidoglycan/xylan/chitin deacetylase (PgdA/CDA1 family)
MTIGTFCISFDTEILWGRHDLPFDSFVHKSDKERVIISSLLKLLSKYNISATWAVVGHLFLDQCDGNHSEIVRPTYKHITDWFAADPGTNIKQNPHWYGKDIVNMINKSKNQEIACHTFSHVIFGDPGCTKECAISEIKACLNLASKEKIKLKSFVFPRNKIGHLDLLKENNFVSYRGQDGKVSKYNQALDLLPFSKVQTFKPYCQNGLVNIPGSFYFPSARGAKRYIPTKIRFLKAKQGIDQAIARNEVFHLWTHPVDFADNMVSLLYEFEEILKYADQKIKQGQLKSKTMEQIANDITC